MINDYPFYKQLDTMDCGPSCLRMISKYYGKLFQLDYLRKKCFASRLGVSLWDLSNAATEIGYRTLYARIDFEQLTSAVVPCILHWKGNHFVVLYKITKKKVIIGEPSIGILTYKHAEFIKRWTNKDPQDEGVVLLLEPTPRFYEDTEEQKSYIGFRFFFNYLLPFKKYYLQIIFSMLAGLGISLISPFLMQSMVDIGINNKNIGFITLVLIGQIVFSLSSTIMNFIRSWVFMYVGTRINIAIISDYLIKLFKLPIAFFDSKMIGDIVQRIGDHGRIQSFVSSSTLNVLFSVVNFVVFSSIMAYYNLTILLLFLGFTIISALWVVVFLKKRKEFNHKFFERSAIKQNMLIQLLYGIRDIKLHNYEDKKRWEWERIQVQTFKISIKQLALTQYQQAGGFLITTIKSITITYLTAKLVVNGDMTIGMMMSMQFILGQIGAPISQFIGLINSFQDARISLERIGEIHASENEEKEGKFLQTQLPLDRDIKFLNVSFSYSGSPDQLVLKNINLTIPEKKITAIVGESGSGKTTILKLLLKFYSTTQGQIYIGNRNLDELSHKRWRDVCGTVLQDGYIFADTIAENIALGDEDISLEKLEYATKMSNIYDFIKKLPQGFNTKIGSDGIGLSQGQKQRILISRSIYRNPDFIFFDEATNALDSKNEGTIMANMSDFFIGKTVVIVAHRLSTIRNADQIIVVKDGEIVEVGKHNDLMRSGKEYYSLIKRQTEILMV